MAVINQAAAKLRAQLFESDDLIVCPGVQDGLSARVCLQQGFKNLYMTGAGTAISLLGMPDLGLTTADDMVRQASMLSSLDRSVPLIADIDTGFGGPVMVARTVERYILGGVAGLHLEDQVTTKRCGHLGGKEMVDVATFVARIRAAREARERLGSDLVIIARTDALQSMGFDEALTRLKAAVEAGADAVFLEGVKDREQMAKFTKEMAPTPCLINLVPGGLTPLVNAKEAKELGYRIAIWPCFAMTHAYVAYQKAAKELLETGAVTAGFTEKQKGAGENVEQVPGGIRELFELCGLSECVEFDNKMGGQTFSKGV
ncbi:Phosphoenolpyruvate/pyruvate domain-containing protein [Neurospora crassa]|uniref:Carboxyvinyl-carboxyphosphonate phosphorylmutase n=1 Tax=Neurospora crassa (strain ATCC 24698 / 74-OR23-1A / CBS 708.71 / DSM 1257 / FGSC 987) TaxID=367110 RepID=Q7RXA0_NEUCR|nr:carboxyvinyl-carboxyphosphonate phosphorylmutase [Neurospora crassa OR74A]EAA27174.1 carboxyvinyl-carboxyphosphonate phosphorylmutase [Neurospora crassa OR74A]KHE89404.1 Phosphoenolpyruvate/pyruvate domain-containing protein [Neurospora crassa]|eukprot:XP_956410.1 carboxyvinyl-carboxyphosphonate phosphorylmutase [Neurospora crassa OR74A]